MSKNLILDTCALVWLVADDERLSMTARKEIEAAELVFVSPISAWEVSLKAARGGLELPLPPLEWFNRALVAHHLVLAKLSGAIMVAANQLPWHHRDPADRFIIATAKQEGLASVTADARFAAYEVDSIK